MIFIQDRILPEESLNGIRDSAIQSGFGTWAPPSHSFGSGVYEGMAWHGKHASIHMAISKIMGRNIYPNSSFFRILTKSGDTRLIHSDRNDGDFTAITYLSHHDQENHGTAFYLHKETGLQEMPPPEEMADMGKWNSDMQDDDKWIETDFVKGLFGRMLIFSAPLFHGRVPKVGIGETPENARMIHVCHFML